GDTDQLAAALTAELVGRRIRCLAGRTEYGESSATLTAEFLAGGILVLALATLHRASLQCTPFGRPVGVATVVNAALSPRTSTVATRRRCAGQCTRAVATRGSASWRRMSSSRRFVDSA